MKKLTDGMWRDWSWTNDKKIEKTLKTEVPLIIDTYPYHESLNPKLVEDALSAPYPLSYETNVKAEMTNWNVTSPNIEKLKTWISSLVHTYHTITQKGYKVFFKDLWFALYGKGDFAIPHSHIMSWMSFVYFIKCPKGSSPLILSGKRIKAEEGKIVIFPGTVNHWVHKNKCEGRIVIAGNLFLCPNITEQYDLHRGVTLSSQLRRIGQTAEPVDKDIDL